MAVTNLKLSATEEVMKAAMRKDCARIIHETRWFKRLSSCSMTVRNNSKRLISSK
eukprot:CAMPEP_0202451406 /NCGR_PEP_ID=MMETSP1360-20130828/9852_1 /ASSEMBLY_ACC=CAM_ASM_000848 /TAXON_ID=515479 /ORGANISM="Licmophora paradoxa, Strain CCMP2313" /LENGTH=54 /DNA_ID=CAMNT_0049069977 /DNA_START=489 /DNA_END=653 /DNA_ORIENTATION=-